MNKQITQLFNNFTVDGVRIPVAFMHYNGTGEPYVIYQNTHYDGVLEADDAWQGMWCHYDFDVYSKGNYLQIIEAVKNILIGAEWVFCPSLCSPDLFEQDTKYYHKTLAFAKEIMID